MLERLIKFNSSLKICGILWFTFLVFHLGGLFYPPCFAWTFEVNSEELEVGQKPVASAGFSDAGGLTLVTSSMAHNGTKSIKMTYPYPIWSHTSKMISFSRENNAIIDSSGGLEGLPRSTQLLVHGSRHNDGVFVTSHKADSSANTIWIHAGYGLPVAEDEGPAVSLSHGTNGFGVCRAYSNWSFDGINRKLHEGDEVWGRAFFFFQSPWTWECAPRVKLFRIARVLSATGNHLGWISILSEKNGFIMLSNEVGKAERATEFQLEPDQWISLEIYVRFSSNKGIIRIWKNEALVIEDSETPTLTSHDDTASGTYLMSYWNGGTIQEQSLFIDDVLITNETPTGKDSFGNPMIGTSAYDKLEKPQNLRVLRGQ